LPWFAYQALRYKKYVGSVGSAWVTCRCRSTWTATSPSGFTPSPWRGVDGATAVGDLRKRHPPADLPFHHHHRRQQLARRSILNVDAVFYFPFDLASGATHARSVRPKLFIMMETEIWPVLLRECHQRGVKTAVVNGRLSSRSFPR